MDTVTEEPRVPPQEHQQDPTTPAAIDPENDMDARTTVAWLSAAAVFVVICLWALFQFFAFSLQGEHKAKIDDIPATELTELWSNEDYYLKKQEPQPVGDRGLADIEASIRASTDGIIQEYVKK